MDTKRATKEENLITLCDVIGFTVSLALELQGLAHKLQQLHEHECNYGLSPRQEVAERKTLARVQEIARLTGKTLTIQGDPRGWPLIIGGDDISSPRVCPF